jgi:hypothetical protein
LGLENKIDFRINLKVKLFHIIKGLKPFVSIVFPNPLDFEIDPGFTLQARFSSRTIVSQKGKKDKINFCLISQINFYYNKQWKLWA